MLVVCLFGHFCIIMGFDIVAMDRLLVGVGRLLCVGGAGCCSITLQLSGIAQSDASNVLH